MFRYSTNNISGKKIQLCCCCCFFLSFRTSHVSHHWRLLKTYIYGSGVQACVCVPVCVNINMNRLTKRYESFSCAHNPWIILHIILCSRIKLWNTSILCQEYGSKATLKKTPQPICCVLKMGEKTLFLVRENDTNSSFDSYTKSHSDSKYALFFVQISHQIQPTQILNRIIKNYFTISTWELHYHGWNIKELQTKKRA